MPAIGDARILIIATNGVEQAELTVPRDRLRAAGARVEIATPGGDAIRGWKTDDWGDSIPADAALDAVDPAAYDALVLPGGQINPDLLRVDPDAMRIVRSVLDSGKVVAAICHGPWLLAEADAVRGRQVTSYPSIRTDLVNAGAHWVDREVVADQGIVTSRKPDDLDAFVEKIVEEVEEGRHRRAA